MQKKTILAAALLSLSALLGGCVVDIAAMADLPSGTVLGSRGGVRSGPSIIVNSDEDGDSVIMAPARRAPIIPAAPPRSAPSASSSDARNPVIQAFTANPGNSVVSGQPITFQVVAHDPGNQPLQYNWAATGGTLSTTSGQLVVWNPPDTAGIYTVSTMITNARGGATSGAQNLTVKIDGSVMKSAEAPAVLPAATPKAAPKVQEPAPAPVKPVPVAVEPCDCDDDDKVASAVGADEIEDGADLEALN